MTDTVIEREGYDTPTIATGIKSATKTTREGRRVSKVMQM